MTTVLGGPLPKALCGRYYECEVLCGLVDGVRDGRGGVLVLRGEAGVGKTALLDHAAAVAAGLPMVRTGVVRSGVRYAGLQQVCAPVLDGLEHLTGAHREALAAVLGLTAGPPPDRVMVGLAVLSLLSHAARWRSLVYLVDDAQWLDPASAQVLTYVGSRLPAQAILLLLAAREPVVDLAAMPSLTVGCLRDADAAELLGRSVRRPLDAQVGERILAEARGNPAVLLRLVQEVPTARRADGAGLVEAGGGAGRSADAARSLLDAADSLAPFDSRLSREAYLDALSAAMVVGCLAHDVALPRVARAARGAPPAARPPRVPDLLLDGLTTTIIEGCDAGTPILRRAVDAVRHGELSGEEEFRWGFVASQAAKDLWDDDAWQALSARHVQLARDRGALAALPVALTLRVAMLLSEGEFGAAAALVDETRATAEETGIEPPAYAALVLAAWRGRSGEVDGLIEAVLSSGSSRGEGIGLSLVHLARAVLGNGLGRHADALAAAEQATGHPLRLGSADLGLAELIEAAVRTGADERAAAAMRRLSACTAASGSDWGLGIEARCVALLSRGRAAERGYREAVERLRRTRLRVERARTHLLYGEWLRREDRRSAAREQLGTAHAIFTAVGAEAFAGRAERELRAVGETSPEHAELTAQETQVARLARDGLSNRDISGRLLISPRTVEWHLRNVFTKLDIASRRELRRAGTTGGELSCRAGQPRRSYVSTGQ